MITYILLYDWLYAVVVKRLQRTCAYYRTSAHAMCVRKFVRKGFKTVRAMCVRAAGFWVCDVGLHFCTLFGTKQPNNAIIGSKKYSILERPFLFSNIISVLEEHFLFSNIISYFRASFPVLKHQKIVEEI